MIEYIKKFLSGVFEKTLITIISAVILSGTLLVYFRNSIFPFIKLIPSFILKFLTFEIPVWIILVVLIILFIVLKVYIAYQDSIMKAKQGSFLQYREDIFDGLIYKWEYYRDISGKYDITDISIFCPRCKCQMIYDDYELKCVNCEFIHRKDLKTENEIEILIKHKLNTKEYLNRINNN